MEILVDVASLVDVYRTLAQLACGRLQVLFGQRVCNVAGYHVVLGHHIGFHPDTERIGATQFHHVAHASHTLHLWNDVDVEVVGDEVLVVLAVGAAKGVNLEEGSLSFGGGHTNLGYFLWQQSLCL